MSDKTIAHVNDPSARSLYPDGLAPWNPATPPDIQAGRTTGRLRHCKYCGSMHPADLAAAIRAGATASWADFKYGWPHKAYVEGIPNPHAGLLESRMSTSHAVPNCPRTGQACEHGEQGFHAPKCECMSNTPKDVATGSLNGRLMMSIPDGFNQTTGEPVYRWTAAGEPAAETTWGKFYTVHLQDAAPEDRETIERHLGLRFTFSGVRVQWEKWEDTATGGASEA